MNTRSASSRSGAQTQRSSTVELHSIRQSRVTEGVGGAELWSVSRVTAAVDEYVGVSQYFRIFVQGPHLSIFLCRKRLLVQFMPISADFRYEMQNSAVQG